MNVLRRLWHGWGCQDRERRRCHQLGEVIYFDSFPRRELEVGGNEAEEYKRLLVVDNYLREYVYLAPAPAKPSRRISLQGSICDGT